MAELIKPFLIFGSKQEPGIDGVSRTVNKRQGGYEIVGPALDDGGPYFYCNCAELPIARQIVTALEFAHKMAK